MKQVKLIRRFLLAVFAVLALARGTATAAESAGQLPEPGPTVEPEQGFYESEIRVEVKVPEGCSVYYTTDGSVPAPGSPYTKQYREPLVLSPGLKDDRGLPMAHVLRFLTVGTDGGRSRVTTRTYFTGTEFSGSTQLPIWSLVTQQSNLDDEKTGIFANPDKRGREWERPVHVTYFADGNPVVSQDAGMRVHGGASRGFQLKSMRLYARSEYDDQKKFEYPFFEDGAVCGAYDEKGEPVDSFRRLLLRNGGNEGSHSDNTMFRDVLTHLLISDTSVDCQASRPVIVYLNGRLYGLFNLQERIDEHYIKEHYDIPAEACVIYEYSYSGGGKMQCIAEAAADDIAREQVTWYEQAFRYVTEHDISGDEAFARVEEYFDIDNLIDYYCMQIFCNNGDWPGNNCKAWRYLGTPSDEPGRDGRIRWILYDTEFAWGLYGHTARGNTMKKLLESDGTTSPYQTDATAMFRALLTNRSFCRRFASRMLDRLNTVLSPEALAETVRLLETQYTEVEDLQRSRVMRGAFRNGVKNVSTFCAYRAEHIREQLETYLSTGGYRTVTVRFDAQGADLYYNGIRITADDPNYRDGAFSAVCAKKYPVEFRVEPHAPQYEFRGVEGDMKADTPAWTVPVGTPDTMTMEVLLERMPDPTPTPTPSPAPTPAEEETAGDGAGQSGVWMLIPMLLILTLASVVLLIKAKRR